MSIESPRMWKPYRKDERGKRSYVLLSKVSEIGGNVGNQLYEALQ